MVLVVSVERYRPVPGCASFVDMVIFVNNVHIDPFDLIRVNRALLIQLLKE